MSERKTLIVIHVDAAHTQITHIHVESILLHLLVAALPLHIAKELEGTILVARNVGLLEDLLTCRRLHLNIRGSSRAP